MTHRGPGDLGQTGISLASGPEVGDVQKVFVCTKRPKVDTPSPCFSPLRSGSELCAAPRAGPPSPTAWSPLHECRGPPSPTAVVPLPRPPWSPSMTAVISGQHRAGSEKSSLLRAWFASGISGLHDAPVWMGLKTRARFDHPVGNCAALSWCCSRAYTGGCLQGGTQAL